MYNLLPNTLAKVSSSKQILNRKLKNAYFIILLKYIILLTTVVPTFIYLRITLY